MRTYGRVPVDPLQPDGPKRWVQVTTDKQGLNDYVYVVTLAQVLKLNLNESPFWANYGIPAKQAVLSQLFPDYFVAQTQRQFAGYFAMLIIARQNLPTPTYNISVTTHLGAKLNVSVPIPI